MNTNHHLHTYTNRYVNNIYTSLYIYKHICVYMYTWHVDIHLTLLSECIGKILWKRIIIDAAINHNFKPEGNLAVNVSIPLL